MESSYTRLREHLRLAAQHMVSTSSALPTHRCFPFILVLVLHASDSSLAQATRYVSPDGMDEGNDCLDLESPCGSIQHAVDTSDPGDSIQVDAGIYNESGIEILKDVTIQGKGTESTILQAAETPGAANDRVLTLGRIGRDSNVLSIAPTIFISNLTIRHGQTPDGAAQDDLEGGGIFNIGELTLEHVHVLNNETGKYSSEGAWGHGGGIFNVGTLTLTHCVVHDNITGKGDPSTEIGGGDGGGIYSFGTLTVIDSMISGNRTGVGK